MLNKLLSSLDLPRKYQICIKFLIFGFTCCCLSRNSESEWEANHGWYFMLYNGKQKGFFHGWILKNRYIQKKHEWVVTVFSTWYVSNCLKITQSVKYNHSVVLHGYRICLFNHAISISLHKERWSVWKQICNL